jgi:DNA ligase D-like protein (predicted 3'-phosphoesterase)
MMQRKHGKSQKAAPTKPVFVVHEHHTKRPHWDFRLELDGVLKSWAVPKQPPRRAGIKRLAVQVDDHDLEYADFQGQIAEGEYGAGVVKIWDRGEYEMLDISKNSLKFVLYGLLLHGTYVLCKYARAGKRAWLFFKTYA